MPFKSPLGHSSKSQTRLQTQLNPSISAYLFLLAGYFQLTIPASLELLLLGE